MFVYGGPHPDRAGCATGQWLHDELALNSLRFDSTQLGGPFYGTQAQALAGPGHQVLRVSLVRDSTWLFGPSQMWFDNVRVNTYRSTSPGRGVRPRRGQRRPAAGVPRHRCRLLKERRARRPTNP